LNSRLNVRIGFAALVALCLFLLGCNVFDPPPQQTSAPPPQPPPVAVVDPNAFKPDEFAPLSVRAQASRVPVIMYHDIIAKRGRKSVWFDCTTAEFTAQMDYLQQEGAHPVSLLELHKHLARGDALPENAIVLTFDDNYQGFYDNAYPLLKARNWPAAMFVHTNYVGNKTSDHPKMTWETLQQLDKEGLVTIASHTMSHPDDISKLTTDLQEQELAGSKQALEAKLGHSVPYLAYPDGRQDATTRDLARKAGYTMAFTIDNGPVEESPDVLALNRYIHTRLRKAWEACQAAKTTAAFYEQSFAEESPVRLEVTEYAGIPIGIVRGGIPSSRRAAVRESVGNFVRETGGVAGINGTFFADARLIGTGCTLIGPSQTTQDTEFQPETDAYRLTRIGNRPIVIWGPKQIAIFPFQPGSMNAPDVFKAYMPDYTDMFLAGAWIVHNGVARTEEELRPCAAGDFQDTRRRAFFGITAKGEVVLGATLTVVSTTKMGEAAAAAGVQEAVLLDSGFSTSLVYDKKIIVTGHTDRNLPSRPVPHAIVVTGTLKQPIDRPSVAALKDADPAVIAGDTDSPSDPDSPAAGGDGIGLNSMGDPTTRPAPRHRRRRTKTHHRRKRAVTPDGPGGSSSSDGTISAPPPVDGPPPRSDNPDKQ
jgi:biofilm PGA synthesis lipoprotein PgaB